MYFNCIKFNVGFGDVIYQLLNYYMNSLNNLACFLDNLYVELW